MTTMQVGYTQSSSKNTLPQIMPKSPDVAALDKYGDLPVSECAGTASFEIPLAKISIGEFSLPIQLSYYKNGLKVEDIPSSVGDGWTLQFGGIVSFQQCGVNDLKTGGLLYGGVGSSAMTDLKTYQRGHMTAFNKMNYLENIIAGNEDSEFDMYNYNFLGKSGQFFYDTLGKIQTMPKNDMQVKWVGDTVVMIDNDNNTYYFGGIERGQRYNTVDLDYRLNFNDITGYQLTRIVTSENRNIYFKYKVFNYAYDIPKSSLSHWEGIGSPPSGCPTSGPTGYTERVEVGCLLPDSILFDNGYVKFKISTDFRQDIQAVAPTYNVSYVKGLTIYNSSGQKVKDYNFVQGYFGSSDGKRLKLSSVEELNGALVDKRWKFQYHNEGASFPSFISFSKDHWGYFNGKTNFSSIPIARYFSIWPYWRDYSVSFADRGATTASMNGMLKQIDYPTGGSTIIEYEPNQIKVTQYTQITDQSPYLNISDATSFVTRVNANTLATQNTVSGSFTIPAINGGGLVTVQITGIMELDPTHFWDPTVQFTGPTPTTDLSPLYDVFNLPNSPGMTGGQWIKALAPGTYTYTLTPGQSVDGPPRLYHISNFVVESEQWNTPQPYLLGGVRVARIIQNDSMGTPAKYRRYMYKDSITQVNFKNIPFYHSSMLNYTVSGLACLTCNSMATIQDESIIPAAGPHIEYPYVTMIDSSSIGILGKTESVFLTSTNEAGSSVSPHVRPINNSWVSGSLSNQKIYKYSGGVYTLIKEIQNVYTESARIGQSNGIRVNYSEYCPISTNRVYNTSLATVFTRRFNMTQNKEINLLPTQQLVTQTDYTVNSTRHTLPVNTSRLDSKGGQVQQKTIYSFDYDTTATANADVLAMRNLQRKNMLVPVEVIQYKTISGTNYVVGGVLTTYQQTKPVPDKVYQLRLTAPIPLTSFIQSNSGGTFTKDAHYELVSSFDAYDEFNQVTTLTPISSGPLSYLYDYKKALPVAEVKNAPLSQVAYTSFEAEQKGNWTFSGPPVADPTAPTGNRCYNTLGGVLGFSGMTSSKAYIVSYWLKSSTALTITGTTSGYPQKGKTTADGWTFFTHRVSGVTSVSISGGIIDEVRLYPETAMMKTYTYDPFKGVTSICDQRNNITYYSYDDIGRLSVMRDQDRRVIKIADYQYLKPITQ
ncbi:RHS repeat domain-containing protein [Chitinophaga tropicalis]|uniref:YD repeat-containing protein n=1 Tax=Chitinophaga tropicalis TaxID=2683588 RepID=A0A7K1U049_9BACT|nr:hypothetical protein [Chitinophaga tropicalis]MVT07723.1 hypothetical protein [Chitinophaga tropicalis]